MTSKLLLEWLRVEQMQGIHLGSAKKETRKITTRMLRVFHLVSMDNNKRVMTRNLIIKEGINLKV